MQLRNSPDTSGLRCARHDRLQLFSYFVMLIAMGNEDYSGLNSFYGVTPIAYPRLLWYIKQHNINRHIEI